MDRGPFASFGGNATAVIVDRLSDNGSMKRVEVSEIGATGVWRRFRPAGY
jgi:hypothetical protein